MNGDGDMDLDLNLDARSWMSGYLVDPAYCVLHTGYCIVPCCVLYAVCSVLCVWCVWVHGACVVCHVSYRRVTKHLDV